MSFDIKLLFCEMNKENYHFKKQKIVKQVVTLVSLDLIKWEWNQKNIALPHSISEESEG